MHRGPTNISTSRSRPISKKTFTCRWPKRGQAIARSFTTSSRSFSLRPKTSGQVSWEASNTLVYRHDTLDPNTQYTVSLTAGYRDAAGNANGFNHGWTVWIDYDAVPGHHNNVAMRVWLTKPGAHHAVGPVAPLLNQ